MTRNTSSLMLVFALAISAILLLRLSTIIISKAFNFICAIINDFRLVLKIRHVTGIKHIAIVRDVRHLGEAVIIPPKFDGDLIIEPERAVFDKGKRTEAWDKLLEMGEDIIPALIIIKNTNFLSSHTKKAIEELIEEI